MSKKEAGPKTEVDEHGLVVHKYTSTVLVVVPPGYAETTLRYARSSLFNVHVGTRVVSSQDGAVLRGELQDEFQVDGSLAQESMDAYSGLILCGGSGAAWLAEQPDVLRLVRAASEQDKLIGAWGLAVLALAKAGVVRKKRVTASSTRSTSASVRSACTGRESISSAARSARGSARVSPKVRSHAGWRWIGTG